MDPGHFSMTKNDRGSIFDGGCYLSLHRRKKSKFSPKKNSRRGPISNEYQMDRALSITILMKSNFLVVCHIFVHVLSKFKR